MSAGLALVPGGGCECWEVALCSTTATSGDGGCGGGGSSSRLTTLAGRRGSSPSKTSTAPINRLASMGLPLPTPAGAGGVSTPSSAGSRWRTSVASPMERATRSSACTTGWGWVVVRIE